MQKTLFRDTEHEDDETHLISPEFRASGVRWYILLLTGYMGMVQVQLLITHCVITISAANRLIGEVVQITEKAPTRAFSWLTAPTSAFIFKTLLRHYANQPARPF